MSKADKGLEGAHMMIGFPYKLGWESSPTGKPDSRYDVYEPTTVATAKYGDCSGDVWADMIYAGVTRNGKPITKADRRTAQGWYNIATIKLAQPQAPGDLFFLAYANGAIHHMGIYFDNEHVFEMGDGTGKAAFHTVAHENARYGIRWARVPGMDWGQLSPPGPVYVDWPVLLKKGMHSPYVKIMKTWLNPVMKSRLDTANDYFWTATEAVVIAFQKKTWPNDSHRWDGVVGDLTQKALYAAFVALK